MDADDEVQEVYYRMLRHRGDPDLIRDPLAYLNRVARNVRSQRSVEAAAEIVCYDSSVADMAESAAQTSGDRRAAEDPAEIYRKASEIRDRLARLSWAHRMMYVLHEQYGYTRAEIAVWLDVHESMVRRYLVECNKKLAPRRRKTGALFREPGKG